MPTNCWQKCVKLASDKGGKKDESVGGAKKKNTKFTFINHSRTHFKRSEMNEKKSAKNGAKQGRKRQKKLLHTFRPQVSPEPSVCGCGCGCGCGWGWVSVGFVFNALPRAAINVNLTPASHFTSCEFVKCKNVSNWALIYDTISETRVA